VNVGSLLERHAKYRGDHLAVVCGAHRLSFSETSARVNKLANVLTALGLAKGDKDWREVGRGMPGSAGYTGIAMANGSDALSWIRNDEHAVDMVLTDVVMPGMTGDQLAAALTESHPTLPVLFASGHADERLSAAVIADPLRFLAQPFCVSTLRSKVRPPPHQNRPV